MIELRVLGAISLRRNDQDDIASVLAQPKRLGLLTYLASAGEGFRRKDILVAMFWPELDQPHGRAALRNALYFLRTALGAEVVVARGEEVGVDRARLWCDAASFDVAIAAGDHAAVLQLDRGDLLEGLHVSDAQPFEEWLETERARRRLATQEAAIGEARRHAGAGRLDDALGAARRAKSLAPLNEEIVRTVMALQYLGGDVAGALDEHHLLETRLSTELDAAPAYETQQFIEAIRNPGSVSAAVAVALAQLRRLKMRMDAPRPARSGGDRIRPRAEVETNGHPSRDLDDRYMLRALLDLRLGLARHGGGQVGVIRVSLPTAPAARIADAMRDLAGAIAACVRNEDRVTILDDDTLIVLPGEGSPAVMNALIARFRAQIETRHRAAGAPADTPMADVIGTWIDARTTDDPLAALASGGPVRIPEGLPGFAENGGRQDARSRGR